MNIKDKVHLSSNRNQQIHKWISYEPNGHYGHCSKPTEALFHNLVYRVLLQHIGLGNLLDLYNDPKMNWLYTRTRSNSQQARM